MLLSSSQQVRARETFSVSSAAMPRIYCARPPMVLSVTPMASYSSPAAGMSSPARVAFSSFLAMVQPMTWQVVMYVQ